MTRCLGPRAETTLDGVRRPHPAPRPHTALSPAPSAHERAHTFVRTISRPASAACASLSLTPAATWRPSGWPCVRSVSRFCPHCMRVFVRLLRYGACTVAGRPISKSSQTQAGSRITSARAESRLRSLERGELGICLHHGPLEVQHLVPQLVALLHCLRVHVVEGAPALRVASSLHGPVHPAAGPRESVRPARRRVPVANHLRTWSFSCCSVAVSSRALSSSSRKADSAPASTAACTCAIASGGAPATSAWLHAGAKGAFARSALTCRASTCAEHGLEGRQPRLRRSRALLKRREAQRVHCRFASSECARCVVRSLMRVWAGAARPDRVAHGRARAPQALLELLGAREAIMLQSQHSGA